MGLPRRWGDADPSLGVSFHWRNQSAQTIAARSHLVMSKHHADETKGSAMESEWCGWIPAPGVGESRLVSSVQRVRERRGEVSGGAPKADGWHQWQGRLGEDGTFACYREALWYSRQFTHWWLWERLVHFQAWYLQLQGPRIWRLCRGSADSRRWAEYFKFFSLKDIPSRGCPSTHL